ncbi:MAG: hypothetical protein IKA64_02745 [Clostridia bacterium]|nr:hypothetical protein [Clostridia bacterium]
MERRTEFVRERVQRSVFSESTGEYALPDYNTDIKKILLTEAEALPSGAFPDGDALECAGVILYKMVYLDAENNITHLEFTTDYDFAVRCNGERYIDSSVSTRVANFAIRLMGPRKIVAKATLESDVHINEQDAIEIQGDAADGAALEERSVSVGVREARIFTMPEREYAEELCRIVGAISDEVDVLYICGEACDVELCTGENGRALRGSILVRALVGVRGSEPCLYERYIQINEAVDDAWELDDGRTDIVTVISSLVPSVNAEEDGVSITVSAIVEHRLRGSLCRELSLLCDCYRTDRGVRNEYSDFSYTTLVDTGKSSEKYEMRLAKDTSGYEGVREVLCCRAHVRSESASTDGRGVKISGEIRFSGVACEVLENGETVFVPVRLDLPFEQNVNINCQICDNMRIESRTTVGRADITVDASTLSLTAELSAFVSVLSDERVRRVSASELTDEEYVSSPSRVVVYFPTPEDTLFEVARRYHTTPTRVASVNSLTEECVSDSGSRDSLRGIKRLVIK